MTPYDLHVHTVYCDGENTPEELAGAAVKAGLGCLGFTPHWITPFDRSYCLADGAFERLAGEVAALRERYAGRLAIYLGVEADLYGEPLPPGAEYGIASCHYLKAGGEYIPVDGSPEEFRGAVERLYGGDYYRASEDYYRAAAGLAGLEGCRVAGHFDLITKFNEGGALFSEDDPRYRRAALCSLDAALDAGMAVEVNTGALARGYRKTPYPAAFLLRRVAERGGRVVLSGDTHKASDLGAYWRPAAEYAAECGVRKVICPEAGGYIEVTPEQILAAPRPSGATQEEFTAAASPSGSTSEDGLAAPGPGEATQGDILATAHLSGAAREGILAITHSGVTIPGDISAGPRPGGA